MKTEQTIECPKCHHRFNIEDVIQKRMEEEINRRVGEAQNELAHQFEQERQELQKRKEELERQQREQDKLLKEKLLEREAELRRELKDELAKENEPKLKALQEDLEAQQRKIIQLQDKELELERLKRREKEREREFEIRLEKEKTALVSQLEEQIRRQENERIVLILREKDKQLDDLRKQLEEAQRKASQGSMQLQGEVQELAIEETLRRMFQTDDVREVPKGCRGADSIQIVRDRGLNEMGKIIYESKRTKAFNQAWIDKLKADQQLVGADLAVLVTQTLPEGIEHIGEINGVWVCDYHSLKGLALVLRNSIVRLGEVRKSQANKGDKMEMLYEYLTSNEFKMRIEAIVEGFANLHDGIARERRAMEKIWKEREKQILKVLDNAIGFYGEVKGIAGSAVPSVPLLELDPDGLEA